MFKKTNLLIYFYHKDDRILKFPFAVCPTNKVKWVLSTDPLKPNSEKTHQELFLIKLIEYWTQAFPTPNLVLLIKYAPLLNTISLHL